MGVAAKSTRTGAEPPDSQSAACSVQPGPAVLLVGVATLPPAPAVWPPSWPPCGPAPSPADPAADLLCPRPGFQHHRKISTALTLFTHLVAVHRHTRLQFPSSAFPAGPPTTPCHNIFISPHMSNWSWVINQAKSNSKAPRSKRPREQFTLPGDLVTHQVPNLEPCPGRVPEGECLDAGP